MPMTPHKYEAIAMPSRAAAPNVGANRDRQRRVMRALKREEAWKVLADLDAKNPYRDDDGTLILGD